MKRLSTFLFLSALTIACQNNAGLRNTGQGSSSTSSTSTSGGGGGFSITSVNISGGMTVFTAPAGINQHCGGTNECFIVGDYVIENRRQSPPVQVPRQFRMQATSVISSSVMANLPAEWNNIPEGTSIKFGLDTEGRTTVRTHSYTKGQQGNPPPASFVDAEGNPYYNIRHYTAWEKPRKAMDVYNQSEDKNETGGGNDTVKLVWASKFCTSNDPTIEPCQNIPLRYSSQSHYVQVYTPDGVTRHKSNSFYQVSTIRVSEKLKGAENDFYPDDIGFALSNGRTEKNTIPVVAPSVLAQPGLPETGPNTCTNLSGSSGGGPAGSSVSFRCIGWAAPKENGACKPLPGPNGTLIPTYALRRYISREFLPDFGADGKLRQNVPKNIDYAYVLDIPLNSTALIPGQPYTAKGPVPCGYAWRDAQGVTGYLRDAGAPNYEPNKEYLSCNGRTIGGDCRASNGTAAGAIGATTESVPTYRATYDPAWDGKNIDGMSFPYYDDTGNDLSCAAALPFIQRNASQVRTGLTWITTNRSNMQVIPRSTRRANRMFIRGIKPWYVGYTEDKTFEACAPEPLIDGVRVRRFPPLHFRRDNTGNGYKVSWCAEVYPTQIDATGVYEHDQIPRRLQNQAFNQCNTGGNVPNPCRGLAKTFTSHVQKNTVFSPTQCDATVLTPSGYPALGYASHAPNLKQPFFLGQANPPAAAPFIIDYDDETATNILATDTCDRTAEFTGSVYRSFPLLTDPKDTEELLKQDAENAHPAKGGESIYQCQITWDDGNGKVGETSADGCCKNTKLKTTQWNMLTRNTGHLEPSPDTPYDTACGRPDY